MIDFKDQAGLDTLLSDEFGDWSESLKVTQQMIDDFAELSGDKLWIHTDPARCLEQSPFKSTIAHGFLVLSLLSRLPTSDNATAKIGGYRQIMNYGSDKLRFLAPVPVDSAIHSRSRVASVVVEHKQDKPSKTKLTLEWQVAVVGQQVPSLSYFMTIVFM